jgi:hypothetical protein
VNPLPVITVNNGTVCSGQSFTITPAGAVTYTLSSVTPVISPTATASYSVSGTNSYGCTSANPAISTVTVRALPQVSILPSFSAICLGETGTLAASGATSYLWDTGISSSTLAITPTGTYTYYVTGENAFGCKNTALVVIAPELCTGIINTTKMDGLYAFPNPFENLFQLFCPSVCNITIHDCVGRMILAQRLEEGLNTIDLTNRPSGLYLLECKKEGQSVVVKLIKN